MRLISKITYVMMVVILLGVVGNCYIVEAFESGEGVEGDYKYKYTNNDEIVITGYTGNAKEITTPVEINGKAVAVIGGTAFNNCDTLEKVTISEGVRYFGGDGSFVYSSVFEGCDNLKFVELPSSLYILRYNPFINCPMLESVIFPNDSDFFEIKSKTLICKSGQLWSYFDKDDIKEYTISEEIFSVEPGAFFDSSLQKINVPENTKYVGGRAFPATLKEVYFTGGYCDFVEDSMPHNATVYGLSNGILQRRCQDYGIPFISLGEVDKYTSVKLDELTTAYLYEDKKYHFSFSPDISVKYTIDVGVTCDGLGYPDTCEVVDAENNTIECSKGSDYYTYECELEKGKTYYISIETSGWHVVGFRLYIYAQNIPTSSFNPSEAPQESEAPKESEKPSEMPSVVEKPTDMNWPAVSLPTPSTVLTVTPLENSVIKIPSKVLELKAKAKKKTVQLNWKKVSDVSGYQLNYSTSKKFEKEGSKKKLIKRNQIVVKNLKNKKTYYFRIRAYKLDGTKKIWGKWSEIRKVKITN